MIAASIHSPSRRVSRIRTASGLPPNPAGSVRGRRFPLRDAACHHAEQRMRLGPSHGLEPGEPRRRATLQLALEVAPLVKQLARGDRNPRDVMAGRDLRGVKGGIRGRKPRCGSDADRPRCGARAQGRPGSAGAAGGAGSRVFRPRELPALTRPRARRRKGLADPGIEGGATRGARLSPVDRKAQRNDAKGEAGGFPGRAERLRSVP